MKTSESGFTFIEALLVVVVTGLIAAMGIAKLGTLHKMRKLDGEARALYSIILQTHAQVLKKDLAYIILFDKTLNKYAVYEDRNANGVADAAELMQTYGLPSGFAFGVPTGGPASGPNSVGVPSAKVETNWATAMLLSRDRAATINTGSLYLSASSLKSRAYCIRMPSGSRNLEFWRWDGSRWMAI